MNIETRKNISIVLSALSAITLLYCFIRLILSHCTDIEIWSKLIAGIIVCASCAIVNYFPQLNGQYGYHWKDHKWGWKSKAVNDPFGRRFILFGCLTLWFSQLFGSNLMDNLAHESIYWMVAGIASIIAIPILIALIIWTHIRIYKDNKNINESNQ